MTQDTYPEDFEYAVYIFDGDVWDEFVTNDMHEAEVEFNRLKGLASLNEEVVLSSRGGEFRSWIKD